MAAHFVSGVLILDQKVLLWRRKGDPQWHLPGGPLLAGELPEVGVSRLLSAQLAAEIQPDRLLATAGASSLFLVTDCSGALTRFEPAPALLGVPNAVTGWCDLASLSMLDLTPDGLAPLLQALPAAPVRLAAMDAAFSPNVQKRQLPLPPLPVLLGILFAFLLGGGVLLVLGHTNLGMLLLILAVASLVLITRLE